MSLAIDTNLLLYASDSGSRHHEAALSFLTEAAAGPGTVYLPWPVLMAYLRIATHPTVFAVPLSPAEAEGNVSQLLSRPHVQPLAARQGFWGVYQRVCSAGPMRGGLVTDAWIAALCLQYGVTHIATNDRDFNRFDFLKVVNPLA